MKRFLFLLAWISGSDGEEDAFGPDEHTKVNSQEDLTTEFFGGNETIFAVEIFAPNTTTADALGYKEAFFDNYTCYDTLSICREILPDLLLPAGTQLINYESLVGEEGVREKIDTPTTSLVEEEKLDYASTTND